ncbi:hypothetical protein RE476_11065 [Methanolobus mangrovi]|uniref:DUF5817 domain-containing protein n=1 Tax=Methanolobus mangrovi TaxID=3072977 RepID=A0AA51YGD0_9EURY|nr:hypothetical protein [Methanolobus mangrovi]WMW21901.1 hypothetical protein RE476_11065 [Methanolobus mangrovi]
MAYGVVICTKCRKNAQIIELESSKTTRCQRCDATLTLRKLRILFSAEELNEAISFRTQVQASIVENETYTIPADNEKGPGTEYQAFGLDIGEKTGCFIDNRVSQRKKKADELILNVLRSNDKQMLYGELKKKAIDLDVDEDRFDDILKKMLQAGEIYSPSKDIIRLV